MIDRKDAAKFVPKPDDRCPSCSQKVNSQSQSGAAVYDEKEGLGSDLLGTSGLNVQVPILAKELKVEVDADDASNAQAQGQIVQSDRNSASYNEESQAPAAKGSPQKA